MPGTWKFDLHKEPPPGAVKGTHMGTCKRTKFDLDCLIILVGVNVDRVLGVLLPLSLQKKKKHETGWESSNWKYRALGIWNTWLFQLTGAPSSTLTGWGAMVSTILLFSCLKMSVKLILWANLKRRSRGRKLRQTQKKKSRKTTSRTRNPRQLLYFIYLSLCMLLLGSI